MRKVLRPLFGYNEQMGETHKVWLSHGGFFFTNPTKGSRISSTRLVAELEIRIAAAANAFQTKN